MQPPPLIHALCPAAAQHTFLRILHRRRRKSLCHGDVFGPACIARDHFFFHQCVHGNKLKNIIGISLLFSGVGVFHERNYLRTLHQDLSDYLHSGPNFHLYLRLIPVLHTRSFHDQRCVLRDIVSPQLSPCSRKRLSNACDSPARRVAQKSTPVNAAYKLYLQTCSAIWMCFTAAQLGTLVAQAKVIKTCILHTIA